MAIMRSKEWAGFRSVVCPVDFSDPSRTALRYAAAMADRADTDLIVLYANDPLLATAAAIALHDRRFAQRSAGELRRFIRATLARPLQDRLRIRPRVVVGPSAEAILDAAVRTRSDLIVMGTHGLTGADRLLLGSTTLGVLQRTTVPVLAVPPGSRRRRAIPPSWPKGPIVAAIEVDREAREEVEICARVARWFGRSLLLLHVVERPMAPAWLRGALQTREQERLAGARDDLERLASSASRQIETGTRVVSGHPAKKIASAAAAANSELLITALRDRRGWFGARRGSVSYHVLSRAAVPVLACPPQWRPR